MRVLQMTPRGGREAESTLLKLCHEFKQHGFAVGDEVSVADRRLRHCLATRTQQRQQLSLQADVRLECKLLVRVLDRSAEAGMVARPLHLWWLSSLGGSHAAKDGRS